MIFFFNFKEFLILEAQCGNYRILREISFGESRMCKTGVLAIFGALNLVNLVNCRLQKVQESLKLKIQNH